MTPAPHKPEKPALVLLPGMDGTGRLFERFVAELAPAERAIIVSYPLERKLSLDELEEVLERALPANGSYVLIAESFSGPIAIAHASKRPDRLKALVLCATFATAPIPNWLRWLGSFAGMLRLPLPKALVRLLLVGDGPDELVEEVRGTIRAVEPSVLVHRMRQILTLDVRERLAALEVPVLYLEGKRDRLVGSRGSAQCEGSIERFTHARIDGPHLLLQSRPLEAAEQIERFLRGEVR